MGSISAYETTVGKRYRVRYRKPDHSQTDKRGFRTKREAEDFLSSVEVSKLRGDWVDPTRSRISSTRPTTRWQPSVLPLSVSAAPGPCTSRRSADQPPEASDSRSSGICTEQATVS